MSEKAVNCTSSGVPLVEEGSTSFPCPGCNEESIGRSPRCRNQGVLYNCTQCGYQGPRGDIMGLVVMTYKLNPDSDVEDVNPEAIADYVKGLANDVYDVQQVEVKPLAFGLKFVQVHVVMNDGPGLTDEFEALMSAKAGVGEIEVLSMGLI